MPADLSAMNSMDLKVQGLQLCTRCDANVPAKMLCLHMPAFVGVSSRGSASLYNGKE